MSCSSSQTAPPLSRSAGMPTERISVCFSGSVYPLCNGIPSDDSKPELCGGIWGFGIFDNGDQARIDAAKTFIKFACDDAKQGIESVGLTGFFPVRASQGDVYKKVTTAQSAWQTTLSLCLIWATTTTSLRTGQNSATTGLICFRKLWSRELPLKQLLTTLYLPDNA